MLASMRITRMTVNGPREFVIYEPFDVNYAMAELVHRRMTARSSSQRPARPGRARCEGCGKLAKKGTRLCGPCFKNRKKGVQP